MVEGFFTLTHRVGARHAHARRIVPFIGAIFRTKAGGMYANARMELAYAITMTHI
jgi:hypothetical protein